MDHGLFYPRVATLLPQGRCSQLPVSHSISSNMAAGSRKVTSFLHIGQSKEEVAPVWLPEN